MVKICIIIKSNDINGPFDFYLICLFFENISKRKKNYDSFLKIDDFHCYFHMTFVL